MFGMFGKKKEAIRRSRLEAEAAVDRGIQSCEQELYEHAISEFRSAIRLNPDDVRARYHLGLALGELGKHEEAVPEFRRAIRIEPAVAAMHLNLANALINTGKLDEAIPEFRAAIRLRPDDALAPATLAFELLMARRSRRDDDEALRLARRAVELEPGRGMFARILALAEYRAGHWAECLAAAERAVQSREGGDITLLFILAVAHWMAGDKEEARLSFARAVHWAKHHAPEDDELRRLWAEAAELMGRPGSDPAGAAINRGIQLSHVGRSDEAIAQFREGIRLRPDDARAYLHFSVALRAMEKLEEAIAALDEAVRLDPGFANAWSDRGWYHLEREMYDEAFADFTRAIEVDPAYALAYHNRGVAYTHVRDWDRAIADWNKTLELNPDHPWTRGCLSDAHVKRAEALLLRSQEGDIDRAMAEYEVAIRIAPDSGAVYYSRGIAHYDRKMYAEAVSDFTRAIQAETTWERLFERGRAYYYNGQFPEAIADLTAALDLRPDNPHILRETRLIRAEAYQARKEHDRAIADLSEVIGMGVTDPDPSEPYVLRGTSHLELGRREEAIADFTRAIRIRATPDAYRGRATAYRQDGRLAEALGDSTELIDLRPVEPAPYRLRAQIYREMGDDRNASLDETRAQAALCLHQALECLEESDWDRAISLSTEAIRLDPAQPKGYVRRGIAYLGRKEPDRALADLNYAIEELPSLPSTARALAEEKRAQARRALGEIEPTAGAGAPSTVADPRGPIDPAMRRGAPPPEAEDEPGRPSARRVASRAMVLSAIVCRALLEQEHADGNREHADGRTAVLSWLDQLGLIPELEAEELAFLTTPVGRASRRQMIDGEWRKEGLSVLGWALGRFALPPYDQSTDPDAALQSLDFLSVNDASALRESARLRPHEEIRRFASHFTIVHWRIRQFRIDPGLVAPSISWEVQADGLVPTDEPPVLRKIPSMGIGERMDFEGYLREHQSFQHYWLDHLRLLDGDLIIGDRGIADALPGRVGQCFSIALERQIAANWLRGGEETYSMVDSSTLLAGC